MLKNLQDYYFNLLLPQIYLVNSLFVLQQSPKTIQLDYQYNWYIYTCCTVILHSTIVILLVSTPYTGTQGLDINTNEQ